MKTAVALPTEAISLSSARLSDYLALTRPRMAVMVLLTVLIGGVLGSVGAAPKDRILVAVVSTALVTAAASAINQWMERETDARMKRTADRPLPAGRLTPGEALAFGSALALIGLTAQALLLPPAALAVTTFTLLSYLFVYTPVKQRTTLNTLIGAVPGALPPVIGWAAVRGEIDAGAVTLFLIVFFWQVPHFLAIAWMYREEYARAGHRMLTVNDPGGRQTARQMLLYLLALVPVSVWATTTLNAGWTFAIGALALAAYFLRPVLVFRREPSYFTARAALKASLVYLPGMLALLVTAKYLANS